MENIIEVKHLKKDFEAKLPAMLSKLNQTVEGIVRFDSIEKDFPGYIYVYQTNMPPGNRRLIPADIFIENLLDKDKIIASIKK